MTTTASVHAIHHQQTYKRDSTPVIRDSEFLAQLNRVIKIDAQFEAGSLKNDSSQS